MTGANAGLPCDGRLCLGASWQGLPEQGRVEAIPALVNRMGSSVDGARTALPTRRPRESSRWSRRARTPIIGRGVRVGSASIGDAGLHQLVGTYVRRHPAGHQHPPHRSRRRGCLRGSARVDATASCRCCPRQRIPVESPTAWAPSAKCSASATRCSMKLINQVWSIVPKKGDVRIEYPVHSPCAHTAIVQGVVRAAPGPEPVAEPDEVLLVGRKKDSADAPGRS